ncbi:MAG: hypothetical protein IJI44_02635 [Erysipelotrichaceae bacterium]|nr:hypothetical protein [Erysipelotrichaceae bacterium]
MIRYSTSNDRICKIIRNWCRKNNFLYSFDEDDRGCVYPFVILAPSHAEKELMERIRRNALLEELI